MKTFSSLEIPLGIVIWFAVLAFWLIWFLYRIIQTRALSKITQAIMQRSPVLTKRLGMRNLALDEHGQRVRIVAQPWSPWFFWRNAALDELRVEINDLIAENREQQRLRTGQLAQLDATLGSLQEAVLIIDADNTILLANKALRSIFPDSASALHQRFEHVIHSAAFLEYVAAVRNGTALPQQEIAFTSPHETRWVEVTGATIPPGDGSTAPAGNAKFPLGGRREAPPNPAEKNLGAPSGPWTLFVLHDITRQKKLEAIRKDFVANVSHELRTPLSLVKGCAETLVDAHRDMPVADREKFLLTIQRHSERLDSLIEDLLTLSRLESSNPGLQLERISFPQFATALIADQRARPAVAAHQITLTIAPEIAEVTIDPRKLTQVFENLIGNALKYTPAGSRIDITARLVDSGGAGSGGLQTAGRGATRLAVESHLDAQNQKRRDSVASGGLETAPPCSRREIEVCVRDDGPGIPAADLPHIFERFYRVDKARSRETGGTGLGLSIVKHIVQLHGGSVRVESTHGQGAAFYFTLPA